MSARLGASVEEGGVRFSVWTPAAIELVIADHPDSPFDAFETRADGVRELFVPGVAAGARYGYRIGGQGPFPDVASRFQPDGVHGLSEVIDPRFDWTDATFTPVPWSETVLYELHVGAFTPEGTFRAAQEKLPLLRDLGVTAVELMPLGDFPGGRNWGYDGVSLYAPSRAYGRPEDLRSFVDRAHELGLSVFLDVVYNHFGADGAYHRLFHPGYYSADVRTPWGEGLNFDGEDAGGARRFFIENGRYWLDEFHLDGFRLDATHAIVDRGEHHFLAAFAAAMRDAPRAAIVIAEDERNLAQILHDPAGGGYGLDAVWADDFHHQIRCATAGDRDGYFMDYCGAPADIVRTMHNGWFYDGQPSRHRGVPRGTPSGSIDRGRFVICIQNHDQVGNRARGERLHHQIPLDLYLAASTLLLLAPETPLLFMGQEWAASAPFQFFTDHGPEIGPLVTEGRRREFAHFPEFADPEAAKTIPDPQDEATFLRSKLNWTERDAGDHAAALDWYRRLLALRRDVRAEGRRWSVREDGGVIVVEWCGASDAIVAAVSLHGAPVAHPGGGTLLENQCCIVARVNA